ncbi:head GIN domain-containing protein [Flaviaesturariibacter aridisoli]|uniref:DUF2807 domain-containing protein n=1 Tax=Flaviaesturariibacter aridisoli TaxID=2545761 RepID=A0A4R4DYF9_9BACT|nr:head GIN domain-containing protein [Flaviaesturariibacter aridisoli]TCZ70576.1 DUF2807 domain-containing protein [Flaviaesturariibacter aridisoli]
MRLFSGLLFLLLFSACQLMGIRSVNGNGVRSTQSRSVGSFDRVEITGSVDVELAQAAAPGVRVETDENLQEYVETEVDGNTLHIRTRSGVNLREHAGLKVFVSAASFREVEVTGSGNVAGAGKLSGDKMQLRVTGSGNARLDVDVPQMEVEVTGSGTVLLSGTTRVFRSETHGSGTIKAFGLLSEETRVEVSGSGDAEVFASKKLEVEVSGSGDVAYKGTAAVVHQEVHGSGSVRKVQ